MSLIKIVLSAVALLSTILFFLSVYLVLGRKKSRVPQIAKTLHHLENQEL
jgi:uncharacterized membrane protein (UPF0182 family)